MIPLHKMNGSFSRRVFAALLAALSLPVICIGQDGLAGQPRPNTVIADSLRRPLQEGITNFVVQLPEGSQRDRFTFINENAAVRGELKISVSNDKLAANDPRWTAVNGTILFNRKRLFNLSMVGVEANYVKLTFHVEKGDRLAAMGL